MDSIRDEGSVDQVTIRINGESKRISEEGEFVELLNDLENQDVVEVSISEVLQWSSKFFLLVVGFVTAVKQKIRFQYRNQESAENLFEALLALEIPANDLEQYANLKQKLQLVVSVFHSDAIGPCCNRIKKRADVLGFEGENSRTLAKDVKEMVATLTPDAMDVTKSKAVVDAVPGAPVDDNAKVPDKFVFSKAGVSFCGDDEFISTPVVIVSRLTDVNTKQQKIQIAWLLDGVWHKLHVARKTIADNRAIIALSDHGLPVNSENSKDLVRFLSAYEATNIDLLPIAAVTSNLGYHKTNGELTFVLPSENIRAAGSNSSVEFFTDDVGIRQISDGYHSKGSLENWISMVNQLREYPKILFALFASLATALVAFLDFPNLIIDFCGRTSGGKTITLRVGVSAWGQPDEKSRDSALHTWSATKTFLERVAAFANNIVLAIDDSKNAASPEHISQMVYLAAQGHGKGRGTVVGIQPTVAFKTMVLSSGERSLTSFTRDGGTRARTLPIWHSPFEEFCPENGSLAATVNSIVTANYGLAGPAFVQFLLNNQEKWPEWQQEFENEKNKYIGWAEAAENQFAARMAPSLAAITMACWLAHQCFDFDFEYSDPIEPLWGDICNESAEADQARLALEFVYGWAMARQDEFDRGGGQSFNRQPVRGYVGRWEKEDGSSCLPTLADCEPESELDSADDCDDTIDVDVGDGLDDSLCDNDENPTSVVVAAEHNACAATWPYIAFIPARLMEILTEAGFDAEAVIRAWHDNGWLSTSEINRRTRKVRIGGEKGSVRVIAIKREAIINVCNGI